MARSSVRVNSVGVSAVLKSGPVRAMVDGAAERVAENVRSLGIRVEGVPGHIDLPVTVTSYTADRAAASVALAHPSGIAVQAKHGCLTKAAAAAGLEVKSA